MTEDLARDEFNEEFARLASDVWDYGYQTKAAKHFNVSDRTMRRWCSGESRVPDTVLAEMRQIANVLPPPSNSSSLDDRGADCQHAMEPSVGRLCEQAVTNGWTADEVWRALVAISVAEIRSSLGDVSAREALQAALASIEA